MFLNPGDVAAIEAEMAEERTVQKKRGAIKIEIKHYKELAVQYVFHFTDSSNSSNHSSSAAEGMYRDPAAGPSILGSVSTCSGFTPRTSGKHYRSRSCLQPKATESDANNLRNVCRRS